MLWTCLWPQTCNHNAKRKVHGLVGDVKHLANLWLSTTLRHLSKWLTSGFLLRHIPTSPPTCQMKAPVGFTGFTGDLKFTYLKSQSKTKKTGCPLANSGVTSRNPLVGGPGSFSRGS